MNYKETCYNSSSFRVCVLTKKEFLKNSAEFVIRTTVTKGSFDVLKFCAVELIYTVAVVEMFALKSVPYSLFITINI